MLDNQLLSMKKAPPNQGITVGCGWSDWVVIDRQGIDHFHVAKRWPHHDDSWLIDYLKLDNWLWYFQLILVYCLTHYCCLLGTFQVMMMNVRVLRHLVPIEVSWSFRHFLLTRCGFFSHVWFWITWYSTGLVTLISRDHKKNLHFGEKKGP